MLYFENGENRCRKHTYDRFNLTYEGTQIAICQKKRERYIFMASFALDAGVIGTRSFADECLECTIETLEKAVMIVKKANFEGIGFNAKR
mgnify:CR=1 FL=1